MTKWHPSIEAFEVFPCERRENWNDINPSASTVVAVPTVDAVQFCMDLISEMESYPFPRGIQLYCTNASLVFDRGRYTTYVSISYLYC
jgi:hypothetical protein